MIAVPMIGTAHALGNAMEKIIGEPIAAISQFMTEKARMKMQMEQDEHALRMEAEHIKTELEKNREIARIDADVRRWNEEINDYIAQEEIERNKKILDAMNEYRKNMLEDYVSILSNLSAMELRLADEAHRFVIARTEDYMKLQDIARNNFSEEVREAQELYPDDKEMQKMLIDVAKEQRMAIVKSSQESISTLNKDISRINEANSKRMTTATEYTNQIFDRWAHILGISTISGTPIESKKIL